MRRFDDELRSAAGHFARDPLPPETLDDALDPPARSTWWPAALLAGAAATLVFAGGALVGQVAPEASPTPALSETPSPAAFESPAPDTCRSAAPTVPPPGIVVHFPCGVPGRLEFATTARGGVAQDSPPVDRLGAAIRAVLDGPSELERGFGMVGVVPPGSASLLAGVELQDDGLALIDFDSGLLEVNNLATSNSTRMFLTAIRETAFELDAVTALELSAGGSCDAFFEFFQISPTCQHLAKPVEPVSDCAVVAPAELPSGAPVTAARPFPGEPKVSWGSGSDTVTQLPGHRDGAPELPADGTPVEVRGYRGIVMAVGDTPESEVQIGWTEDGCTYLVWIRLGEGLDTAIDYARRYGPVVAAPTPPPAEPVTARVEDQGIRLTATIDRSVTVHGTRVTLSTIVENIGADPVFWGHSGTCAFATDATVRAEEKFSLDHGRSDWTGDAEALKNVTVWIRPETLASGFPFQPEGWLDFEGQMGCTTDYVLSELPPGDRLTHVAEWDTEAWYGMPPPPGDHAVEVAFSFASRGQPPPPEEAPNPQSVSLDVPLTVIGPEVAVLSPGVAFDALLGDARYMAELESVTRHDWTQSDLRFERGRWIAKLYLGRDTEAGRPVPVIVGVVDARTGDVLSVTRDERVRPPGG
jgi:hypothetical protein